jgi:hypothetical protein
MNILNGVEGKYRGLIYSTVGLRRNTQDNRSAGRDSNPMLPEYEAGLLTAILMCHIALCCSVN